MPKVLVSGPLVLLSLALAGCSEKPPKEFPWSNSEEYSVEVASAEYEVSRFWRCGWTDSCPEETWSYCLHVVPHTVDAAVEWYRRLHEREFRDASDSSSDGALDALSGSIAAYEAKLNASPVPENERAHITAEIAPLRRALEVRTRFRAELEALESGDPEIRDAIFQTVKGGLYVEARYSISKAGTPKKRETGYYFTGSCAPEG